MESVCRGNSTVGSNPTLSATTSAAKGDALVKDGGTSWTGVRNPAGPEASPIGREGRPHLLLPHGQQKGGGWASRGPSVTPTPIRAIPPASGNTVDVVPVRRLRRPVTLAEIKADRAFASFALTRNPRLSVMPVSPKEWSLIEGKAKS